MKTAYWLAPALMLLMAAIVIAQPPKAEPAAKEMEKAPGVEEMFDGDYEMELYSIEPGAWANWGYGHENDPSPVNTCVAAIEEGEGILGSVKITDEKQRKEFGKLVLEGFTKPGRPADCYLPRHMLVARGKEHRFAAVQICFQCGKAAVVDCDTKEAKYKDFGDPGSLQEKFDKLLKDAKVPMVGEGHGRAESKVKRDEAAIKEAMTPKARDIFDHADSIDVYHISAGHYADWGYGGNTDPSPLETALKDLEARKKVHAVASFTREGARAEMLGKLYDGIRNDCPVANCYEPHHALVAKKGNETAIVFICFTCNYVVVLDADTKEGQYKAFSDMSGLRKRLDNLLTARNPGVELKMD